MNVKIRRSLPGESHNFMELILMSSPYFPQLFGEKIKHILKVLFQLPSNLFSFEHTLVAEKNGDICGMILGYDWMKKRKEDFRTGMLLLKSLKMDFIKRINVLLRFNSTVGRLNRYEYYISNIAVYPNYRKMGIGKILMLSAEEKARSLSIKRLVLDVEKNNRVAIGLYKKLGFRITKEFSIPLKRKRTLYLHRMIKNL